MRLHSRRRSISFGEKGALFGRLAADDAVAGRTLLIERDRAARGARLLANLCFTNRIAAPVNFGEAAV